MGASFHDAASRAGRRRGSAVNGGALVRTEKLELVGRAEAAALLAFPQPAGQASGDPANDSAKRLPRVTGQNGQNG
jgi:hypothetical protein